MHCAYQNNIPSRFKTIKLHFNNCAPNILCKIEQKKYKNCQK